MAGKLNRRSFLKNAGAAGATLVAAPYFVPSSAFGANERVVMGIIGSGGRGRGVMRDLQQGGAVFSSVCDVYEPNLLEGVKIASRGGPQPNTYVDYREMLDEQKGKVDAFLIATPEHQHCTQLIDVVDAGYDCYCEKPMSHSIREGHRTVKALRNSDRIVQIGMQRRSSDAVRKGKAMIDSGILGEVHFVRVKWNWHYFRTLDDSPLPGELNEKLFIKPARRVWNFSPMMFREWRYFWKFSGGNITDQGTHLMDVVQWYMGEEFDPRTPKYAECFGDVYQMEGSETPDIFTAIYDYGDFMVNWTLNYTSSWRNSWSIEFLGTNGVMVLDDHGWRIFDEPWKGDEKQPWLPGKPPVESFRGGIPTRPHTDNFLDCVKSRNSPNAPPKIGHLAVCGPHLANVAWHKKDRAYLNDKATRVSTMKWFRS